MSPRRGTATRQAALPRFRTPAIRTRGPQALQRALLAAPPEAQTIPPPQRYLGTEQDGESLRKIIALASLPEWYTAWAAITYGLVLDRDLWYQTNALGGRQMLGGTVLDFALPELALAWAVLGMAWHYQTTAQEGTSRLLRVRLAGLGITLIFLDDDALLRAPRAVVAAALKGEDQSRLAHS